MAFRRFAPIAAYIATLLVSSAGIAVAQFSGSVSTGIQSSSNIQSLDTTSPDRVFLPALQLNYDWRTAATSRLTFGFAYAPNFYSVNTPLSYNVLTLGVTGLFYLSNGDAIRAEETPETTISRAESSTQAGAETTQTTTSASHTATPTTIARSAEAESKDEADDNSPATRSDSLVDHAVAALYALSGKLDSITEFGKGLSKSQREKLSDLRDSVSDALTTDADLLDSLGYGESTADIMIAELTSVRGPLARIGQAFRPMLDAIVGDLRNAKPSSDYLPITAAPLASTAANSADRNVADQKTMEERAVRPAHSDESETESTPAPAITQINSSTRIRDFAASDVEVREDAEDSSATTLASVLTIPVAYSIHSGQVAANAQDSILFGIGANGVTGNPNDVRTFSLGAAIELLPSATFSARLSFDHTDAKYPFDSVYTNTENRFRIAPRIALSSRVALFGEFAYGLKKYENPLTGLTGKSVVSDFSQTTYGLGITGWIGERWAAGILFMANTNPNLRAYVTQGPNVKRRVAAQVADDEYTYDLNRYAAFSTARIFWDMDMAIDVSYEHRVYGSASRKILKKVLSVGGQTEDGTFPAISVSKMWAFENRVASVFTSLTLSATLSYSDVSSSDPTYAYTDSEFMLNGSLGF